jgi:hypothetical protein
MRKIKTIIWLARAALLCALCFYGTAVQADGQKPVGNKSLPAPSTPIEAATRGWLAFLAYQGGFTTPEFHALNQTPNIMLFHDGRLIFRDDNLPYNAPNRRREMWREAKISPEVLKAFIAKAKEIEFLTVQPPPAEKPKPDANGMIRARPVICDAATTILGLELSDQQSEKRVGKQVQTSRIVSEYALGAFADEDKDNRYVQSLLTFEKTLQNLRPKESKRYEPDAIRVSFLGANSRGVAPIEPGVVIPAWPLVDKPNIEGANFYSGKEAQTLIELLGKNSTVSVGGQPLTAIWTPAIGVPQNAPEKPTVPQLDTRQ